MGTDRCGECCARTRMGQAEAGDRSLRPREKFGADVDRDLGGQPGCKGRIGGNTRGLTYADRPASAPRSGSASEPKP
jgi:hypothetical protein